MLCSVSWVLRSVMINDEPVGIGGRKAYVTYSTIVVGSFPDGITHLQLWSVSLPLMTSIIPTQESTNRLQTKDVR